MSLTSVKIIISQIPSFINRFSELKQEKNLINEHIFYQKAIDISALIIYNNDIVVKAMPVIGFNETALKRVSGF